MAASALLIPRMEGTEPNTIKLHVRSRETITALAIMIRTSNEDPYMKITCKKDRDAPNTSAFSNGSIISNEIFAAVSYQSIRRASGCGREVRASRCEVNA